MLKSKITFLCLLGLFLPFFSVHAGIILDAHKFAWGEDVGYINFENVIVNDSALLGHAWSANEGWINFSPTLGGVLNDGAGNLSGSAWGEGLGWIDFNNVSINTATGKFSGTATSLLSGTITFDCTTYCDVETDWRPGSPPSPPPPAETSGVGGGTRSGDRRVVFTPFPIFGFTPTTDASTATIPTRTTVTDDSAQVPGLGQFGQEPELIAEIIEGPSPMISVPESVNPEIDLVEDEGSARKSFSMIWLALGFMGIAVVYIVWRMWQQTASE